MIAVIDYEMGNLRSVAKALECVGGQVTVTNDRTVIEQADRIVLPGVGAFPDGIKNLREHHLTGLLHQQVIEMKKPFLGICLGMQLLAKKSYEFGETEGLGWIDAEIVRFEFADPQLRVPHVGWNDVEIVKPGSIFSKTKSGDNFYFVHSYYMKNNDPSDVAATCDYGGNFTAAIQRGNIFATQFHPEKSQSKGLDILEQFVEWNGR